MIWTTSSVYRQKFEGLVTDPCGTLQSMEKTAVCLLARVNYCRTEAILTTLISANYRTPMAKYCAKHPLISRHCRRFNVCQNRRYTGIQLYDIAPDISRRNDSHIGLYSCLYINALTKPGIQRFDGHRKLVSTEACQLLSCCSAINHGICHWEIIETMPSLLTERAWWLKL